MSHRSLPLKGLRVLVVDDDPDSRDLLTLVFEEYGIETIATRSAQEALGILKHIKPDLLISEIRLHQEDGYSLIHKVRAAQMQRQVQFPALALTVYASKSDRAIALANGFDQHLSKPFDIDELIATVAYLALTQQVQTIPA